MFMHSVGSRSCQHFGFVNLPGKVETGSESALKLCLLQSGRGFDAWERGHGSAQDGHRRGKILSSHVKVGDQCGCGDGKGM
jgi:hypothetical protein